MHEVIEAIARAKGIEITPEIGERRAGDPAALTADSRAIRARFGWQPAFDDLDTIVTHALVWERSLSERAG